ncbi:hypothetical protein DFH94DRAFT_180070 [Russula ochroleuca]|uniref:Uncharacterized protein n=1 Tax=Russula ochroleuca TaxID=152965 RepID=A0A9P5TDQ5_9AGAM|nr:hypothetical protein DFH94DRAFT_180070 [Russula ochroleuca]
MRITGRIALYTCFLVLGVFQLSGRIGALRFKALYRGYSQPPSGSDALRGHRNLVALVKSASLCSQHFRLMFFACPAQGDCWKMNNAFHNGNISSTSKSTINY